MYFEKRGNEFYKINSELSNEKRVDYRRANGLRQCLKILGFEGSFKQSPLNTFSKGYLNEMIEKLYIEQSKKYHPDKHPEDPGYYTILMANINKAHDRSKHLIKKKGTPYEDAWKYIKWR